MISHLQHTNVSAISKELSNLLASNGSLSSSRVLTLVVLAEKGHSREAINAAIRASHEHPSRIIVHIAHNSDAPDQLMLRFMWAVKLALLNLLFCAAGAPPQGRQNR